MDIHTNPSEATWTRNLAERSAKSVSELASELTRPLARAPVGPLSSGNRLSSLRMFCSRMGRSSVATGPRPERNLRGGFREIFFGRALPVRCLMDVEGQVDGPAVALGPRPRGIPACPTSALTFSQKHFSPSCDGRRKPDGRSSKKPEWVWGGHPIQQALWRHGGRPAAKISPGDGVTSRKE
jgi:hypothetical protein